MRAPNRAHLVALVAGLLATACAGPSGSHKAALNAALVHRDWGAAVARIDGARESQYGEKNAVLFLLDKAAVLHQAGRYDESDVLLDQAEQRLEALYTRSVTRTAGTFLVNDNTDEYRGDPHERAQLHLLRAMNFAVRSKADEGAVEARKLNGFLAELRDRVEGKAAYRDDAFGQYLASLLYEDVGQWDDARISRAAAVDAYRWYGKSYGVRMPNLDPGDAPSDHGELVLIHYNGPAPRRESRTIQVAWNEAAALVSASDDKNGQSQMENAVRAGIMGDAITVAFPVQVQDAFQVAGSEVVVGGRRVQTELVQDLSAIARQALEDRNGVIRARAIARATVKFVAAKVAQKAVERQAGSTWGFVAGLAARAIAAGTEVADTRCWSTMPAQLRLARIRLPAGVHAVDVRYLDASGQVLLLERLEVEITKARRTYVPVHTTL